MSTATGPVPSRRKRLVQRRFVHVMAVLYRWAQTGWSKSATAAWAFANSSLVPGPRDALLIPLGLSHPRRAYSLAASSTLGSFAGALLAYAIGVAWFDSIGRPLLMIFRVGPAELQMIQDQFTARGWLIVFVGCLGVLPVRLLGITAGGFGFPLHEFAPAVLAGRSLVFFVVGTILRFAGARLTQWIEKRTGRPMPLLR